MTPVLWGAVAALSWGTADFMARFTGRAVGFTNAFFAMMVSGTLALTVWIIFSDTPLVWFWRPSWLLVCAGVGITIGGLCFYRALTIAPLTLVAPIAGCYPALVVALAVVLGRRPSITEWAAMAVVVAGVVAVARFAPDADETPQSAAVSRRQVIMLSLAAAFGFAVAVAAGQAAAPIYGGVETAWVTRLIALAAMAPVFLRARQVPRIPARWWPALTVQGFLDAGAFIALFAGSMGPGAEITAVVAAGFGAVTVILARLILREAMGAAQWAGIAAIFAGAAVLSG